jgi:tetratricopeptide (TPR) repeat protein
MVGGGAEGRLTRTRWKNNPVWVPAAYLLLAVSMVACDLPQPPAGPPALSADQLIEVGHDLRAKEILTPLVEADPANANAAWLLSKALTGLGDLAGALAMAERSVSLDNENAAYHVQLGAVAGRLAEKASIFKQLGLARRARKELEAAVALDPKNLDGLYGLMLYYFSAPSFLGGDRSKANDLADRIAAVDPTRGLLARGTLAHERKDPAAELDFTLRAVGADPDNFDTQSALLQYDLDRPQRDWIALEKIGCKLLQLHPGRPDGWRVLIEVHVASHCWTELEQVLQASEQFNHEDLSPYYTAAAALLREDERRPAAQSYLEKYLSQPPDGSEPSHAMARCQLATLLEREQHPDEAVAQLNLALQEDPGLEAAKKDLKRLRGN